MSEVPLGKLWDSGQAHERVDFLSEFLVADADDTRLRDLGIGTKYGFDFEGRKLLPPRTITSRLRPMNHRYPSSSKRPKSPV